MDTPTLEALIVRAVEYLADHEAADEGDHPLRQILGERIHLARRRSGLSQVELATRADISPATLNRVELGRQKLYVDTLVTLARILGVSVDYLVGMTDDDRTLTLGGKQADDDAARPPSAPLKAKRATRPAPSPTPSRQAAKPVRATARRATRPACAGGLGGSMDPQSHAEHLAHLERMHVHADELLEKVEQLQARPEEPPQVSGATPGPSIPRTSIPPLRRCAAWPRRTCIRPGCTRPMPIWLAAWRGWKTSSRTWRPV